MTCIAFCEIAPPAAEIFIAVDIIIKSCRLLLCCDRIAADIRISLEETHRLLLPGDVHQTHLLRRVLDRVVHEPICIRAPRLRAEEHRERAGEALRPFFPVADIRDDPVPESSLIVRCLACAEWTPCAALDYVARYGLPARPAELKDHNCLVYARGHDCDEWRFTSEDGEKAIRISGDLRSTDPHAVRTATLAAHGVALLPDAMISKDLQAGRLIRVLSEYSAEPATVRAIYPSRRQLARKVRTFLDFAAASFGGSLRVEFRAGAELRGRAPLRDEPPKAPRPSGPGSDRARGVALAGARALNGSGGVLHAAATL